MKYTVNLYRVNNKGFLTARACMKSALQLGGSNIRDTRLLSAEMPEWNSSAWYAPVPMDEYAYMKLRARYIKRVMPDLRNPEVLKHIKEHKLDLRVMRGILATDEKSYGGLFLQYLMSYPRWVNARGGIEIGGEDYFTILQELAEAQHNATDKGKPSWEADTRHIATISDRMHQRMERAGKSQDPTTAWCDEEADMRGGIDETSALFLKFVNMVGAKTGCNAAAGTVINTIKKLIELLGACGINDFSALDAACNETEDAFTAFNCALATKQDIAVANQPNITGTPQNALKTRKRYPQDKEALDLLKEAARRKGTETYAGCSSQEVIRQMMDEHTNWEARILHGKLHGKKGGREQVKAKDRVRTIDTWGKYLSAYILDHPSKAGKK